MASRESSWSGKDLTPLPFESLVSCLWRFGWRNKLNAKLLMNICSSASGYPKKDFFDNQYWFNRNLFLEKSAWPLPIPDEQDFVSDMGLDSYIWVERTFRYCPLCLEHCFHSFWYQFIPLTLCPIHDVPLCTKCHCCDARLPHYGFSKALFEHPYCCAECGNPISGVKPSLNLHLQFRECAPQLAMAFRPFMTWWNKTTQDRLSAYELYSRRDSYRSFTHKWCRPEELIRSVVCNEIKLPSQFKSSLYPRITQLQWKIRIFPNVLSDILFLPRRSWAERVRIPMAVYRCTLRLLKEWVMHQEGWSEEEFNEEFRKVRRGKGGYSSRLLALYYLRFQLEGDSHSWGSFSPLQAQLKDEPSVKMDIHWNRTPRRGWFAIFLAMYVSWYFRILKIQDRELDEDFMNRHCADDAYIFLRARTVVTEEGKIWVGAVAFPHLDGIEEIYQHKKIGIKISQTI